MNALPAVSNAPGGLWCLLCSVLGISLMALGCCRVPRFERDFPSAAAEGGRDAFPAWQGGLPAYTSATRQESSTTEGLRSAGARGPNPPNLKRVAPP